VLEKRWRTPGASLVKQSAQSERGQALILWILAATVILVMGAVVVDVGLWLTERRRAQNAADFAALAAATELHPGGDPVTVGERFAQRNGFGAPDATVTVTTPYNGDDDLVEVTIEQSAPMLFADIFGAGPFDIGARAVGTDPAQALDVVIILDRSESIEGGPKNSADVDKMKDGARAALKVFDPTKQHVALGVMSDTDPAYDGICGFTPGQWLAVPLRDDYKDASGALNASSDLVRGIDCLGLSDQGTNWELPIDAAITELQGGQLGARKAIILLADGHPQEPEPNPCQAAVNKANEAEAAAIEIYTIGYAVEHERCEKDSPSDWFATPLAEMAKDISINDNQRCVSQVHVDAENADPDHFFCQLRSVASLEPVFAQIAEELARDYRLEE
jgi:hypothetical protein